MGTAVSGSGKKGIKGWLIAAGVIALTIASVFAIRGIVQKAYDSKMKQAIVPYSTNADAAGTMIVSFNEDSKTFTDKYLPKDRKAKDPGDVRYILYYRSEMKETRVEYHPENAPKKTVKINGKLEKLTVTLVDLKTGETVATKIFGGEPPEKLDSKYSRVRAKVDSDTVTRWIRKSLNGN